MLLRGYLLLCTFLAALYIANGQASPSAGCTDRDSASHAIGRSSLVWPPWTSLQQPHGPQHAPSERLRSPAARTLLPAILANGAQLDSSVSAVPAMPGSQGPWLPHHRSLLAEGVETANVPGGMPAEAPSPPLTFPNNKSDSSMMVPGTQYLPSTSLPPPPDPPPSPSPPSSEPPSPSPLLPPPSPTPPRPPSPLPPSPQPPLPPP
ncbi:hypothetical protein V8C86DRAFT_3151436, partial [Haematococcus lacustris]